MDVLIDDLLEEEVLELNKIEEMKRIGDLNENER